MAQVFAFEHETKEDRERYRDNFDRIFDRPRQEPWMGVGDGILADARALAHEDPPPPAAPPPDTANHFLVSAAGSGDVLIMLPRSRLSPEDALNLAAWLVAVSGRHAEFPALLKAVLDT